MVRTVFLLYGLFAYIISCLSIVYLIGFVGNAYVPKSIDTGPTSPFKEALLINIVLLAIFFLQHTLMARERFKRWICQFIPETIERSTFSLLSSLSIGLLFWQWRPITGVVWSVEDNILSIMINLLFYGGWIFAFYSTFLINHFHLFGLRQVYVNFKIGAIPSVHFKIRGPYKYVRYPILLGYLIALFSAVYMTFGHLLFSFSTSLFIINGIRLKDKDLLRLQPKKFLAYKNRVNTIIPIRLIIKK